jgi:hypothetical protein
VTALDHAREELRTRAHHLEAELTRTLDELDRTRIALSEARQAADRSAG